MNVIIPHMRVKIEPEAYEEVARVLNSGNLVMGKKVEQLEEELCSYIGHPHAVAVSSGTSALHLALCTLKKNDDDEVILPSYVCISLYNAVIMAGMTPRLVDVDVNTANIDFEEVKKTINSRTRAIIVPHMFGYPAPVTRLSTLGIPIIEDCAHAVGGQLDGQKLGSLAYASVFSFYATKMLGGAEGGAVLCQDYATAAMVKDLRDYSGNKADWKLRYNYKLSDVHAAITLPHLRKLDDYTRRRTELAARYRKALEPVKQLLLPHVEREKEHIYYRFIVRVAKAQRDLLKQKMADAGIGTGSGVLRAIHQELNMSDKDFPLSSTWQKTAISLPIYPSLAESDQDKVIEVLLNCVEQLLMMQEH